MPLTMDPTTFSRKYHDTENHKPLYVDDGCPLDQWLAGRVDVKFAFHPSGFPVFLKPAEIARSDEYRDGDPYSAAAGLEKWPAFQNRRLHMTLRLLEEALGANSGNSRVLDVACGEGVITSEIKKKYRNADVCGIDYSLSAIEAASRQHTEIELAVGDAYHLPYTPESFDVVVLNNIWEHVPDPLLLLEGTKRVLRPGGVCDHFHAEPLSCSKYGQSLSWLACRFHVKTPCDRIYGRASSGAAAFCRDGCEDS